VADLHGISGQEKPVIVSGRSSAAEASRPDIELEQRFHTYESNPIPWWLTVVWMSFFIFGLVYLVVALLE